VLLVLAILVVLGSLVTVALISSQTEGYSQTAKTQILALEQAVIKYKLKTGQYPMALDDLVRLPQGLAPEKWGGPHLTEGRAVPKDPWDNAYTYTLVNNGVIPVGMNTQPFIISSNGPNEIAGDMDDISNKVVATQ
jgi:type II secretion system protein G